VSTDGKSGTWRYFIALDSASTASQLLAYGPTVGNSLNKALIG